MKIKNLPKCQIIEMSLSLILPVFMIVVGIKFEIDNLIIDFISILLFKCNSSDAITKYSLDKSILNLSILSIKFKYCSIISTIFTS